MTIPLYLNAQRFFGALMYYCGHILPRLDRCAVYIGDPVTFPDTRPCRRFTLHHLADNRPNKRYHPGIPEFLLFTEDILSRLFHGNDGEPNNLFSPLHLKKKGLPGTLAHCFVNAFPALDGFSVNFDYSVTRFKPGTRSRRIFGDLSDIRVRNRES